MDNLGTSKIDSTAILLKSYEKKQEAATYFNLKPAIVVEIGSRWTRYGMSGEYHPRGLLNSIVVNPDDGKKVHWLSNELPKEQKQCLILSMMKTIVNRLVYFLKPLYILILTFFRYMNCLSSDSCCIMVAKEDL